MNAFANEFCWMLGRTTLALSLAALATAAVLRLARANWPTAHRLGWTLVLLAGWVFLSFEVAIPWYDAPVAPTIVVAESQTPAEAIELSPSQPALVMPDTAIPLDEPLVSSSAPTLPPISPREVAAKGSWAWPDWPVVAASLWLSGMVVLAAGWLVGYARFVRRLLRSREIDPAWQREWDDLMSAAGVGCPLPLRITEQLGPMLCRLPAGYELLVPEGLWRELDAGQRRAILRHELAHYVRGDVWKSLAMRLLALPHWFNPLSWYAARRFDEAAEWACDRVATADLPATTYAKALLRLVSTGNDAPVYGSAARGRALAARIRRLVKSEQKEDSTMKKIVLVTCGLVLAGLTVVRLELVAKEPPTTSQPAGEPRAAEKATAPAASEATTTTQEGDDDDDLAKHPVEASVETRSMVEEARKAYEAHQAAYEAETAPLESLYAWSLRWMRAADSAAKDSPGKVAAAKAHLKRMQNLQTKIAALFNLGAKGGEAKDLAAANYYVAEARKHLADLEAKTAAVGPVLETAPRPVSAGTQADVFDLQIKIAELEGQLKQTVVDLDAANAQAAAAKQAYEAAQITDSELLRLKAEQSKLVTQRETLTEQVRLYKQKLDLVKQAAVPQPSKTSVPATPAQQPSNRYVPATTPSAKAPTTAPPAQAPTTTPKLEVPAGLPADPSKPAAEPAVAPLADPTGTPGSVAKKQWWDASGTSPTAAKKRSLRYAGKDFDAWVKELDDLSLERRAETITALAAFGANGYGTEAATHILDAMRGVTIWLADPNSERVKSVAVEAFKVIPTKDAWPLVKQAAASDNANQRMFVTWIVHNYPREETLPVVRKLLADSDERVRAFAVDAMVNLDVAAPELVDALHSLLTSENNDVAFHALRVVYLGRTKPTLGDVGKRLPESTLAAIAPDLVGLLARPQLEGNARGALVNIGEPVIPALEKALETGDKALREKVEGVFDSIRKPAEPQSPNQ